MQKEKNIKEFTKIQNELADQLVLKFPLESLEKIKIICGLDVHFPKENTFIASGVLLSFPKMEIIDKIIVKKKNSKIFPYKPGFLSFREIPIMLEILEKIKLTPDVVLCDGQGIAHPRRLGLAAHLGVILKISTIGCAKSHLYGEFEEPPPGLKGAYQFLKDADGDILGMVLRTKPYVQPLFVSPGNLMDVETASDIVLKCCINHRIPEPLRLAHIFASKK